MQGNLWAVNLGLSARGLQHGSIYIYSRSGVREAGDKRAVHHEPGEVFVTFGLLSMVRLVARSGTPELVCSVDQLPAV